MVGALMTPKIADTLDIVFFFFFWAAIFWMIEYSFDYVAALRFSWLVVIACAALFSYFTVWLSKYGS